MKIVCSLKEAADIIRACHDGACYNCALTRTCKNDGAAEKHPEDLIEIETGADG